MFFSPKSSGMSKTSKMMKKNFGTKKSRDVTFQGQGHVTSRSLLLILVAYVRMHHCAKFDANRTIHLRVIQMAPERDGQSNRQSNRQSNSYTQVITIPTKRLFQRLFAVKMKQDSNKFSKPLRSVVYLRPRTVQSVL